MKINEVDPRNYDSDIDYYDALRRSSRRAEREPDDYDQPEPYDAEDAISQQRQAAAAKARAQRKTTWDDKQEGSAPNGKQYNSRYIIDAPNKASADGEAYSFKDHHWGAKNVVDTEYKDLGDGRVELTMYVVDNHKYGMWKPWRDQPAQESVTEENEQIPQEIYNLLDELTADDTGKEEFGDYVLRFEGFTDWCQQDAAERCNLPDNDPRKLKYYDDVYAEVLQGWAKEEGSKPVDKGFAGSEDYPVQWAVFKKQSVAEGVFGIDSRTKGAIQNVVSQLSDIPGMWDHQGQTFTPQGLEQLHALLKNNKQHIEYAVNLTADDFDESVKEKAKNPYAIGMSQAMKSTGDKPPLDKATIRKAHEIAKRIMQKD